MSTLSFFILSLSLAGEPAAEPIPTCALRHAKAIERSLPIMMKGGISWKSKICISCHHIPLAVWTRNEAKGRGFDVDQKKVDDMTDWMISFSAKKKYPHEMVDGFLDVVFLATEKGVRPAQHIETFEMFQQMLATHQRDDGSWRRQDSAKEPGFVISPPDAKDKEAAKKEASEVDTMWALLGLSALGSDW